MTNPSLSDEQFQISFGNFPPRSPIRVAPHTGPLSTAHLDQLTKPSATGLQHARTFNQGKCLGSNCSVSAALIPVMSSPPRLEEEEEVKVAFGTFSPSPVKIAPMAPSENYQRRTHVELTRDSSKGVEPASPNPPACTSASNADNSSVVSTHLKSDNQHFEDAPKADFCNIDANKCIELPASTIDEEDCPEVTDSASFSSPEISANTAISLPTTSDAPAPCEESNSRTEQREPNCGFRAFLALVPCL